MQAFDVYEIDGINSVVPREVSHAIKPKRRLNRLLFFYFQYTYKSKLLTFLKIKKPETIVSGFVAEKEGFDYLFQRIL